MFLGIEIGGTKLQLGLGAGDGVLAALWRGSVNVAEGPEGIRRQITLAVPELLARAGIERSALRGAGIGFGGPVDDATRTIIKSHQIEGWDDFPLADWITDMLGLPVALGNDADVAGLAEALFGAGKGLSPIFYITVGSGIGGGLIIDGEIYRGVGRGAAEIGHLRVWYVRHGFTGDWSDVVVPLEERASGWAIGRWWKHSKLPAEHTAEDVVKLARQDDPEALRILNGAWETLADGICHVISLLCPRRIVIGGGVSLIGEKLFFEPLRRLVAERVFKPFAGLTDIVPAAQGEEVVVHGALALARKRLG
jgi:glucokinase